MQSLLNVQVPVSFFGTQEDDDVDPEGLVIPLSHFVQDVPDADK
jgi:hypothetical protein